MNASQVDRRWRWAVAGALVFGMHGAAAVQADDYYNPVPFLPTVKLGGFEATPADTVYGKEYSHNNPFRLSPGEDSDVVSIGDHRDDGTLDFLQVVSWDGREGRIGGNSGSVDSFDYGSVSAFQYPDGQVDALANSGDFLFRQVIRNESTLLFSVTGDSSAGTPKAHVHYEDPAGGHAIWAAIEALPVDFGPGPGVNHHLVNDLDALEVWGPEPPKHDVDPPGPPRVVIEGYIGGFPGPNTGDSNRFSIDNDALNGGVSVWAYDITTAAIMPWIPHSEIVTAVEKLFLSPYGAGLEFDAATRHLIDVDATMARDIDGPPAISVGPGGVPGPPGYSVGDELLFSIDPIRTLGVTAIDPASGLRVPIPTPAGLAIDGGEIMHLVKTGFGFGPATMAVSYLFHGGHLWDTGFPVAAWFGYDSEDIDALESVGTLTGDVEITTPEPGTLVLCALALPLVAAGLRRRRC